ncbi:hypothetical protein LSH36_638g01022 [Paralvinella palmiformis]|uniref:Uncharacterized protein n=1 Tax=Paralvinella palmiformis TaxID=53620 RepID=A0AAD9J3N2_9ANNE|nr:hypothetical protein LSH36_638g01022 [Paralvinella palmiformis]
MYDHTFLLDCQQARKNVNSWFYGIAVHRQNIEVCMADLQVQDRVTSLERKVTTLEDENVKLKSVITELQDIEDGNTAASKVDIPAQSITSVGSNPDATVIISDISSSEEFSDSDADSSNFQYQFRYRKKLTKLNKRQKKQNTISCATSAQPSAGGIRSARGNTNTTITDMYIGGVHSSHSTSDITEHIQNMGFVIIHQPLDDGNVSDHLPICTRYRVHVSSVKSTSSQPQPQQPQPIVNWSNSYNNVKYILIRKLQEQGPLNNSSAVRL